MSVSAGEAFAEFIQSVDFRPGWVAAQVARDYQRAAFDDAWGHFLKCTGCGRSAPNDSLLIHYHPKKCRPGAQIVDHGYTDRFGRKLWLDT